MVAVAFFNWNNWNNWNSWNNWNNWNLEDSPKRKRVLCPFSSPRPLTQECFPLPYPETIPRPSRSPAGWGQDDRNGTQGRTKA